MTLISLRGAIVAGWSFLTVNYRSQGCSIAMGLALRALGDQRDVVIYHGTGLARGRLVGWGHAKQATILLPKKGSMPT